MGKSLHKFEVPGVHESAYEAIRYAVYLCEKYGRDEVQITTSQVKSTGLWRVTVHYFISDKEKVDG